MRPFGGPCSSSSDCRALAQPRRRLILFLIALRMIFHGPEGISEKRPRAKPFIVPLAIPLHSRARGVATVVLLVSRAPQARPGGGFSQ